MDREQARAIIDKIIDTDLRDRKGLDEAFAECDEETQEDIRETWTDILLRGAAAVAGS